MYECVWCGTTNIKITIDNNTICLDCNNVNQISIREEQKEQGSIMYKYRCYNCETKNIVFTNIKWAWCKKCDRANPLRETERIGKI